VFLQSEAREITGVSGVLGRFRCLDSLCDDFEDENWHYDYSKHTCFRKFWRGNPDVGGSQRGEPELLARVPTPYGGKNGSSGALEIRTNKIDSGKVPDQEDLLTIEFEEILGYKLSRIHQPVFIVRVWLPPFDEWGDTYYFGFRLEASSDNNGDYYPSIWLKKEDNYNPYIAVSIRTPQAVAMTKYYKKNLCDIPIKGINQDGWWTLAIAFDKSGVGYYYARSGSSDLREEDKIYTTTRFETEYGIKDLHMDCINYNLFKIAYPKTGNTSPRFVIDDFEVWVKD